MDKLFKIDVKPIFIQYQFKVIIYFYPYVNMDTVLEE